MKKCKLVQNIMNFKFCYIIFCTIICFIVLSVPTFAKENSDNVIRVGSFEETYNTVNEKGERRGYGYEYLQDIAGYAGWTYKYITSDWKNCFTQLGNGEIDILGGISYTDERAENMLFSDQFAYDIGTSIASPGTDQDQPYQIDSGLTLAGEIDKGQQHRCIQEGKYRCHDLTCLVFRKQCHITEHFCHEQAHDTHEQ